MQPSWMTSWGLRKQPGAALVGVKYRKNQVLFLNDAKPSVQVGKV